MNPNEMPVARRQVQILNYYGLHLRPAEKMVRLAVTFTSEIIVRHAGRDFDGKSILDLMSLAAEQGTRLDLEARGPDAEQAVAALAELVDSRFGEAEDGSPPQDPTS
jgi:phosphocarrier protein